jgi:hypothetical protein
MNVEEAKSVLKAAGFFVENLWSVEDVRSKFDCTDEEAQYCLEKALTNDAAMEQIWMGIDIFGEMENLKKIHRDERGDIISIGDTVIVPDPEGDDMWNHEFQGQVKSMDNDYIVVEDGDGDCWSVEGDRLLIDNNNI